MKWPLVSRRAYDVVVEERDRLREKVDDLTGAVVRMQRWEKGMSETPRQPKKPTQPMPKELVAHCQGFRDPRTRRMERNGLLRRHVVNGESWDDIAADVLPQPEEDEVQPA